MQGKKANYQSENLDIESTTDKRKSLKQREKEEANEKK